jgi:hypothetical protein
MNNLKKKVIIGVNDNEDYLQFWDLQIKIWSKTDWKLKMIFIGDKNKYDSLNKNGFESLYIEPIKNIDTTYHIQVYCQLCKILEDNDTILYHCDMDQLMINKFTLLNDMYLNNLNINTIIHGSICFDNTSYCKKNQNSNTIMNMHNIGLSQTWKKIYSTLNIFNNNDIIQFIIVNNPQNFQLRKEDWGIDQKFLRLGVNNWLKMDTKNNIKFYSMYDVKERWLNRKASFNNQVFDFYDTYKCKIVNENIFEYIKNNRDITWLHPYLGHIFKDKKDEVNNKIKNEIILPLLNYI